MGKSSKEANQIRSDARARKLLSELAIIVGDVFGDAPSCVDAAALFVATARKLGYVATPRAVSMLAERYSTGRVVVVGSKAREWSAELHGPVERVASPLELDWNGAGHVVLSVPSIKMIFDPTFRQFSRNGMPYISFAGSVISSEPEDGTWQFDATALDTTIRYFVVDDDVTWRDAYEHLLGEWDMTASDIAEQLRMGSTADQLIVVR